MNKYSKLIHSMQDDHKKDDLENEEVQKNIEEFMHKAQETINPLEFPNPPEWQFQRKSIKKKQQTFLTQGNSIKGLAVGLIASYALIGPILVGWLLGYLYDRANGGDIGQTIGVLIGMPLGIIGIIYILNKYNKADKK